MALSEGVWRVLIGPDHKAVRARRRQRRAARAPRRVRASSQQPHILGGDRQLTDTAGRVWASPLRMQGDLREGTGENIGPAVRPDDVDAQTPAFDVLATRPRVSGWVRARRTMTATALLVLVVAGVVSITQNTLRWMRPATAPPAAHVSDTALAGAATVAATDYMSWDTTDRPRRQVALRRISAPGVNIDGWDGTGRQTADSASAIAQIRLGPDRAVVITQVRVTPFTQVADNTPASSPSSTAGPDNNNSSAPVWSAPGWTAGPSRWLTIAIPLAVRDGRPVVTTIPSLVSGAPSVKYSAAEQLSGTADDSFAKSTEDSVAKFLESYATGELDFVRAPHAAVSGLDGAVSFKKLVRWQTARAEPGADPAVRSGTASVVWELPNGAGTLRGLYRITVRKHEDRWLLASIEAEVDGGAT